MNNIIHKPLPPFLTQIHNFSNDLIEHSLNNFKKVDEDRFNKRLGICNMCPELREDKRCAKCGCLTQIKLWWEVAKCPEGKW